MSYGVSALTEENEPWSAVKSIFQPKRNGGSASAGSSVPDESVARADTFIDSPLLLRRVFRGMGNCTSRGHLAFAQPKVFASFD